MKIIMGADINGFTLKEAVKEFLLENGHEITDVGVMDKTSPIPYFEVVQKVAKKIQSGEYERGILCCGTGMGVSILANKFKGIYAACVESFYAAKQCRAVNNANVLTMGGWMIGEKLGCDITKVFLNTELGEDLEDFRKKNVINATKKIKEIEEDLF